MALLVNGFEAGTTVGDGANVVAATSGYSGGDALAVVSAGASNTITYSAANKIHGSFAALFTQGSTAASLVELRDTAGAAAGAGRLYGNFLGNGFPSNAASVGMQARSTTDVRLFTCYIDSAGRLRINGPGSSGDVAIGTVALPSSTGLWRQEWSWTGVGTAATAITASLYLGESTTPLDTVSVSGITTSGLADRMRGAKVGTGAAGTFVADSLAVNIGSPALLGPYQSASSDWVRRGGGWVPATYFTRRGGAWN